MLDRYRTHYERKFNFIEMRIRDVAGLRSLRMSWKKISDLLGVSTDTLRRRRLELFRNDFRYEGRSDSKLDYLLAGILE